MEIARSIVADGAGTAPPPEPKAGAKGPDLGEPMALSEYAGILYEIEQQPLEWRTTADKEMDYADGNQLNTELLRAQAKVGIPPAMEDLIGPALESIRGYEVASRTDWRVTPNGQPGGQDVADALNFRLNEAERQSKADRACSGAFRTQIAVGVGFVEVGREKDPFKFPYRCQVVHRNEIHWDMAGGSTDPDEWRFLRRQRWVHPDRLVRVFPKHKELIGKLGAAGADWWASGITEMQGGQTTGLTNPMQDARAWTMHENRYYNPASREVCLAELWYRRWVDVGVIKSPDGRVVEYDASNSVHTVALATGKVKYSRAVISRVRRGFWLGPHSLDDAPNPEGHGHFPYVPFFGAMEDNTGVPYGYVRGLIYQQDTVNSGSAKLRWGLSAFRTERTKGAVAMTDEQFRRTVGRLDADIVLDAQAMAQNGARFEVKRDYQLTQHQLDLLQNAREAIQRINPAAAGAFGGRRGTATSGVQEQTQVEQANQSLSTVMDNFREGRTRIGDLLLMLLIRDMGTEPVTIIIEGDAIKADRTVVLNQPEVDPETGREYLSNDVARTRLLVGLEDVPSTATYRGQQLNAMSEAVKSLPPQYQAAAMPFLASLMDVPFKTDLVEALRAASAQMSPEEIDKRVAEEVAKALKLAGNDLKERELDMKQQLTEAQIKKTVADAIQVGVQSFYSAVQAGAQVATMPQVAPLADAMLQAAGYQNPSPAGVDPNIPVPAAPVLPPTQPGVEDNGAPSLSGPEPGVEANTSPAFPPVPQKAATGMKGIETPAITDNLGAPSAP